MEITWLGHACFRIRGKEATVINDPCDRSTGYSMGKPAADIVTVSVPDPAHSNVAGVGGSPRVLEGPGEYEFAGASITGVATAAEVEEGDGNRRNVSFVIELEDLRICHLGAIARVPTSGQLEELTAVDVLLVPVGGGAAFDAAPAAETVSLIEPKLVIPMHFKTDAEKTKLDGVDRFLKEMGAQVSEGHAKISVTRSSLPGETQVFVLDSKR